MTKAESQFSRIACTVMSIIEGCYIIEHYYSKGRHIATGYSYQSELIKEVILKKNSTAKAAI
jgi:hypothetical protein